MGRRLLTVNTSEGSSASRPPSWQAPFQSRFKIKHYQPHKGEVDVCIPTSNAEISEWMASNLRLDDGGCVVGFDCEWRPAYVKGVHNRVAIVQVATPTSVLLVQLRRLRVGGTNKSSSSGEFPSALADLVGNALIVKTGVGILDDLKLLQSDYGVKFAGFLELSLAADRSLRRGDSEELGERSRPVQKMALQKLGKWFLGVEIGKSSKVRMGNWERMNLTEEQIQYACYDALLAVDVHSHLASGGTFDEDATLDYLNSREVTESLRCSTRAKLRTLWNNACESQEALQRLSRRLIEADAEWLRDPTQVDVDASSDPSMLLASTWRGALFVLLSRFMLAPKFRQCKATVPPPGMFAMEVLIVKSFPGRHARVVGRGIGRSKREAGDEASRHALVELLALQRTLVEEHNVDLISVCAGKESTPSQMVAWLDWSEGSEKDVGDEPDALSMPAVDAPLPHLAASTIEILN